MRGAHFKMSEENNLCKLTAIGPLLTAQTCSPRTTINLKKKISSIDFVSVRFAIEQFAVCVASLYDIALDLDSLRWKIPSRGLSRNGIRYGYISG